MTRNTLAKFVVAALALAGMDAALACSTQAWTDTGAGGGPQGTPLAGEPFDDTAVKRYSGRCGLLGNAVGDFVVDVSPGAEPKYNARFYVYTGVNGGTATVFRALEGANTKRIAVKFDGTNEDFIIETTSGTTTIANAARNRWYGVELGWQNGQNGQTAGMTYKVTGNGGVVAGEGNLTGVGAADVIDTSQLGWVETASGAPAGEVVVDAFESRRSSAPGLLRRANADASTQALPASQCDANDITAVATEIIGGFFADPAAIQLGQPDCTEDGALDANDITCTALIIIDDLFNGTSCGV